MIRKAYSIVGAVLLVELALQFYLIAAGALVVWGANDNAKDVYSAFKAGDRFANIHLINGTLVVPITILVLLGLAFAAGLPRSARWQTAALFGLMVLQFLLGTIGSNGNTALALVGGLHGLNALVIAGLAGSLVFRTWAFRTSQQVQAPGQATVSSSR